MLSVMVTAGCVSWQRSSLDQLSQAQPVRAKYQIWINGRSHYLHAIRTTPDSVFGVPYFQPPDCATCVVSFALATVDSVRIQRESETAGRNVMWITLTAVVVFMAVAFVRGVAFPGGP